MGRLGCQRCGHQVVVAFSCKTRHLCPSCAGRHMEDGTAHLLDYVLPGALPSRQVVVSLPVEVRGLLAFRPNLLNAVFRLVNDACASPQLALPELLDASAALPLPQPVAERRR